MKKTISILLSLLLVLSLAACVKVKTEEEPATKDTTAVVDVTAAPTQAPTPEPTEVPFSVAIADANEKLAKVNSMHMDMGITMDLTLTVTMGELNQSMPLDMSMFYNMDVINEPLTSRAEAVFNSGNESIQALIYTVRDGDNIVQYSSQDDGVTWKKSTNPTEENLPQSPNATIDLFSGMDAAITGTEEVNGKPATVYTGKVDGKRLQEILNSTGAAGEITEAVGTEMSEEEMANLSDIDVTVMIDKESGMPVRYIIDMADAMKDLMMAAMTASMGGEIPEGIEVLIDVASMKIDITMSNFDAVEPIVIPEAALNTPEL